MDDYNPNAFYSDSFFPYCQYITGRFVCILALVGCSHNYYNEKIPMNLIFLNCFINADIKLDWTKNQ